MTLRTLPAGLYDCARVPAEVRTFGALAGAAMSALVVMAPVTSPPLRTPWAVENGTAPDWTQQTFRVPQLNLLLEPEWQAVVDDADEADAGPNAVRSTADQIVRIHQVSGLTWEQLARLFGVSRRTLHSWASGARVASGNLERISAIASLLEPRAGYSTEENRVWLMSPQGTNSSRFDEVRRSWAKGHIMEDGLGVRERLGLLTR